jgi:uncharacterized integral membrane protein (TIGR00698 family)
MLTLQGSAAQARMHFPGLALAGAAVATGFAVNSQLSNLSALTVSLLIGALLGNLGLIPSVADAGLKFAARHLLRAGIVLLGLQLSLREVAHLGGKGFVAVIAVVIITFFGTQFIAQWLGVSPGLGLLTATGYSICGVSAISAMTGAVDGDEDATYAIALVTMFGSICIFALPILGHLFDMGNVRFGLWAGSSVHDVAQVVATSTAYSSESLKGAVIVKLSRVILLAPLVAYFAYQHRSINNRSINSDATVVKTSPLPMFIILFLAMVCVRTTGYLSDDALLQFKNFEKVSLAMALVGLGAGVNIKRLRVLGSRPLLLGLLSWLLVMGTSLATIRLIPLDF